MLCCRACQREQLVAPHRAMPPSPLRGTSNFHFLPIHPVFGSGGDRRWEGVLPSSFSFISLPTQQSTLRASICTRFLLARLIRSSALPPPPCSRGGRPVAVGSIGKQRPKIYFPVSFPSPMSKYSNGSRKNVAGPQFLLTMILSSSCRVLLLRENLTNLKIYDIIYLQGEGRKKNLHHHLHYA